MDTDGTTIGHEENESMKKYTIWDSIMKNDVTEIKQPTYRTIKQKRSNKLWWRPYQGSLLGHPFKSKYPNHMAWGVMQSCHNMFLMQSRNTSTDPTKFHLPPDLPETREKAVEISPPPPFTCFTSRQCKHMKKHEKTSSQVWNELEKIQKDLNRSGPCYLRTWNVHQVGPKERRTYFFRCLNLELYFLSKYRWPLPDDTHTHKGMSFKRYLHKSPWTKKLVVRFDLMWYDWNWASQGEGSGFFVSHNFPNGPCLPTSKSTAPRYPNLHRQVVVLTDPNLRIDADGAPRHHIDENHQKSRDNGERQREQKTSCPEAA